MLELCNTFRFNVVLAAKSRSSYFNKSFFERSHFVLFWLTWRENQHFLCILYLLYFFLDTLRAATIAALYCQGSPNRFQLFNHFWSPKGAFYFYCRGDLAKLTFYHTKGHRSKRQLSKFPIIRILIHQIRAHLTFSNFFWRQSSFLRPPYGNLIHLHRLFNQNNNVLCAWVGIWQQLRGGVA